MFNPVKKYSFFFVVLIINKIYSEMTTSNAKAVFPGNFDF